MPQSTRGRASKSLCVCVRLLYTFFHTFRIIGVYVNFNLNYFLCDLEILRTNNSNNILTVHSVTKFIPCVCVYRVNGKLVALKVIRLQEEEGTPFTAIREGEKNN